MNRPITIGLVGLALAGLSACATDKTAAPASTTSAAIAATSASTSAAAPASPTTTTVTPTSMATSSTATSESTPTQTSAPMVGGMTECTKAALAEPATQAAQALGENNVFTVGDLNCADGWAVASGVLASKDNPGMGAPTSFVFEQQGQFWVVKDKAMVCGTDPISNTPPADAEIPAALFVSGCAAG